MKLDSRIAVSLLSLLMSPAAAVAQPAPPARFSSDGTLLRVIFRSPSDAGRLEHVRAVTYSAKTGAAVHAIDLDPGTDVLSVTSDGATAVISTAASTGHPHLFLLDTATGGLQPFPDSWYKTEEDVDAAISGDGRLVSVYSETDSATPMTVTVYDWSSKTLIATRTSDYVAAGGVFGGGVTEDGEVAFEGSRVGSTIVNLKTGRVMAEFGLSSVRSPNGAWEVQFPNQSWVESSSADVLLKNGQNGEAIGKLDIQVPDNELNGYSFNGAFCGAIGRFILASPGVVAAYALPSGKLLVTLPTPEWKDATSDVSTPAAVACSPAGTRVAVLSGTRLTFHDLK